MNKKVLNGVILATLYVYVVVAFACVPAIPFWISGYILVGCIVFAVAGLPISAAICFIAFALVIGAKQRRKDKESIYNRVSKFYRN